MKKTLLISILSALVTLIGMIVVAQPAYAATGIDPKGQACAALGQATTGTDGDCTTTTGPDVSNTLTLGINVFSFIVGFAAIVMIIIGGLKYILSQGESSNTAGAKNTILYAIIGLVVVLLAQVIVHFVIRRTTTPGRDTPKSSLQGIGNGTGKN